MNRHRFILFFLLLLETATFLKAMPVHEERSQYSSEEAATAQKMVCPMDRNYYLYLPDKIDPDRTYWLVCYAHGFQGEGEGDLSSLQHFVAHGDCIAIAPSFAQGFQFLGNKTDEQLIGILHQLSKKYKLHTKIFVFGHSAGGQFAHRFTLRHPDLVVGCEACSSGSWATGGIYQSLTLPAQNIPIAIACGGEDRGKREDLMKRSAACYSTIAVVTKEDPGWNRVEWLNEFSKLLAKESFFFKTKIFPGEFHQVKQSEQESLAMESFLLGTSGMLAEERATYDAMIAMIKKNSADKKSNLVTNGIEELQQQVKRRSKDVLEKTLLSNGWYVSEAALDRCLESAEVFIKEELINLSLPK